jgi:purine-binding chemotaxis protein CheW
VTSGTTRLLVLVAGARRCALRLVDVRETMRPLPAVPVAGAPAFVLGAAVIRGAPTPVVDLAALLGDRAGGITRFVTVDAGGRRVALAVDAVRGIEEIDRAALAELPPLLAGFGDAVIALGAVDGALLALLESAALLPPEVA